MSNFIRRQGRHHQQQERDGDSNRGGERSSSIALPARVGSLRRNRTSGNNKTTACSELKGRSSSMEPKAHQQQRGVARSLSSSMPNIGFTNMVMSSLPVPRALPLRQQQRSSSRSRSRSRSTSRKPKKQQRNSLGVFLSSTTNKKNHTTSCCASSSFSTSSSSILSTTSTSTNGHVNIFDSGIVAGESILSELDKVMEDENIVGLELEDFVVGHMIKNRSVDIPQKIAHVLRTQMRPWEGICFVDELHFLNSEQEEELLITQYQNYKKSRKQFFKGMDGVCAQQVIARTVKTKINVSTIDTEGGGGTPQQQATESGDAINSQHFLLQDLIQLLGELERDRSLVSLTLAAKKTTPELIRSLTSLLLCDHRHWETVSLDLGGVPGPDCKAIKCLQKAAAAREITDFDLNLS